MNGAAAKAINVCIKMGQKSLMMYNNGAAAKAINICIKMGQKSLMMQKQLMYV